MLTLVHFLTQGLSIKEWWDLEDATKKLSKLAALCPDSAVGKLSRKGERLLRKKRPVSPGTT